MRGTTHPAGMAPKPLGWEMGENGENNFPKSIREPRAAALGSLGVWDAPGMALEHLDLSPVGNPERDNLGVAPGLCPSSRALGSPQRFPSARKTPARNFPLPSASPELELRWKRVKNPGKVDLWGIRGTGTSGSSGFIPSPSHPQGRSKTSLNVNFLPQRIPGHQGKAETPSLDPRGDPAAKGSKS